MKSNKILIAVIVILVIFLLLTCIGGGVVCYLWKRAESGETDNQEVTSQDEDQEEGEEDEEDDDQEEDEDDNQVATGSITGKIGYPSEYIPDQRICAENVESGLQTCIVKNFIGSDYSNNTYTLEVVPGDYYIFAQLVEAIDGATITLEYKAYYSEFVTCGMSVDCISHDPLEVTVLGNDTIEDVDPIDWYDYDQMDL